MSNDARWMPDPTGRHEQRYWDGQTWTEHVSDGGRQSVDALQAPTPVPSGGGGFPRWAWAATAVAVVVVIAAAVPASDEDGARSQTQTRTTFVSAATPATEEQQAATPEPAPTPVVELAWDSPEETTRDKITLKGTVTYGAHVKVSGHRAAVVGTHWTKVVRIKHRGENRWPVTATKKGHESDELEAVVTRNPSAAEKAAYRRAEARRRAYARAVEAAENYLSFSGFSKKGLFRQLSSSAGEGFTEAEAQYAVDHVEVDWKAEAVESAKSYLSFSPMSREQLIQQLSSDAGEGYTYEQAVYAVGKVY